MTDAAGRDYLLCVALLMGGLPERLMSWPVGIEDGAVCGCAVAAPVVIPGALLGVALLARGAASRWAPGAAGVDVCAVFRGAAFWAVEDVPARSIDVLFRP